MDIATYIANYQTTPVSAELGTAQLQLVPTVFLTVLLLNILNLYQDSAAMYNAHCL